MSDIAAPDSESMSWLRRHPVAASITTTLVVLALVAFGATIARAATGTVSSVTLSVVSDGTAPFDADNNPGDDAGPNNGIVRTSDFVTYRWDYSVSVAGDITFTQTLPTGMRWDTSSTTNCSQGAAAISGQTLTCTFANAPAGAGAYQVKAKVLAAANGATLTTSVRATTGGVASNSSLVTVSAGSPRASLDYSSAQNFVPSLGPGAFSGTNGVYDQNRLNLYMPVDPVKGVLGLQALATPIVFSVTPPASPSGGVLRLCGNSAASGNDPAINKGTITCSQPGGAGTPITVTLSNIDSSLDTWPTKAGNGTPLDPSRAYFFDGYVSVWYPQSSFPANTTTVVQEIASGFDPNGLDGSSNFGSAYAPNQQPGASCVTASPANCAATSLNTAQTYLSDYRLFRSGPINVALPGATAVGSGDAPLYPDETDQVFYSITTGAVNVPDTNLQQCLTWDPSLVTVDPTVPAYLNYGVSTTKVPTADYIVEYGSNVYASDSARLNANCGTAGDGASGWYSSISAVPGGASAITSVRVRWVVPVPAGTQSSLIMGMERTSFPLADGAPIQVFSQFVVDGRSVQRQAHVAHRAFASSAAVRNSVSWDAATGQPGDVRKVTVQPTVTTPDGLTGPVAQDVRVSVSLPDGCVAYQLGSASLTPVSVSPVNPNACPGGVGQTLVFDLGPWPVNTPVPPITFNTVLNPLTPSPSTETVSSTISSASDLATAVSGIRTASASLPVNALATFAVTKTASSAMATPGVPFTYTIGWANRLSTDVGTASFVDVLPYNGDARGTTGLNGLTVNSVTPSTGAVSVWYTSDPSSVVAAAVSADPSGNTGITWSQVKPATVTAIQFRTDDLLPGTVESAVISVTPGSLSRTGTIGNDVWGKATNLAAPVQGAAKVTVSSSAAELSGNVFNDLDYSFSKTAGDAPVANPVVEISGGYAFGPDGIDNGGAGDDVPVTAPIVATSSANGDYDFPGVAPGKYTVVVVPPAGTHVVVSPSMPITLNAGATVTGKDFGVQPIIPAPVANPDVASTGENTTKVIDVMGNDTFDASATITAVTAAAQGGLVLISADGTTVSYTPPAGFVGDDTFTYTIADKARQSSTATVTVHVVATPVANPDTASTGKTTPVSIPVLSNDTPAGTLTVTAVGSNSNGSVVINPDGTVTFTPNGTFTGTTSFSYTVTDGIGQTSTSTVTVTVVDTPTARDDSVTSKQDTASTVNVLANDTGDAITVKSVGPTAEGAVVINPDGTVTFTPNAGFSGDAVIPYSIVDAVGQTASATLTVHVIAAPVAHDDQASTGAGVPAANLNVLTNDTGTGIHVTAVGTSPDGTAVINPDGTVTFTPNGAFTGDASFPYTITDSVGQTATATVTVHVAAAPQAVADTVTTGRGVAATVAVLANDSGAGIHVTDVGASPDGTAVINQDGTVTFTPNASFTGAVTIPYTITDQFGVTATSSITVIVVAPPKAVDDQVTSKQDTASTVTVLSNDSGTGLTVTGAGPSADGTVVINPDGTLTFTPNTGFAGDASFPYTVTDVAGQTASATVTVHVIAAPVAKNDSATTALNTPVQVAVLGNDTGTTIAVTGVGTSPEGTAVINQDGTITFTPNSGFTGTTSFDYTITDALGQTATATVTVTVRPAPNAVDDTTTIKEGATATVNVLANDTGTNLTVTQVGASPDGTAVINPDGTVTFTPNNGFTGTTSFTYTETDDLGQTSSATVTVVVVKAPTAADDEATTGQGAAVNIAVLANDTGTQLTVTAGTSPNGTVVVNADRSITFTPNAGYSGDATFTYTDTDPLSQTATATVTVHVIAAPTAGDTTAKTGEQMPITVNVAPLISGDSPRVTGATSPNGAAAVNPDGTVSFTPAPGFTGTATVTYTVTDALGQTTAGTITVTVVAVPVANPDKATTDPGKAVTINVAGNDTGENITVVSVGTTPDGTLTLNPDGTITFTPNNGFAGDTTFTYTIVDDLGQSAIGTVTVHVNAPPAPPTPTPSPSPTNGGSGPTVATDGGGLAQTGSTLPTTAIILGALAILLGALALTLNRRRRNQR